MHDRRRILLGTVNRLRERVGHVVPGGIHAARAAGLADPTENRIVVVTVGKSTGSLWDPQSSALARTYVVTIHVGVNGLAPDLAGSLKGCPEELDEIASDIEGDLKRNDVLTDDEPALGFRPMQFDFFDDDVDFVPGGRGQIGNLILRYAIAVLQDDGHPTRS